jgi:hypothetical protein
MFRIIGIICLIALFIKLLPGLLIIALFLATAIVSLFKAATLPLTLLAIIAMSGIAVAVFKK